MRFIRSYITLPSSFLFLNQICLYGVLDILELSRQLSYQYSKPHAQQPKSAGPSMFCLEEKTLFEAFGVNGLSTSLPKYSYTI